MDASNRTILDDLEAGDFPVSLKEARKDRRLMLDGKAHDLPWIHRAATKGLRSATGVRIILETIVQSGRRITTYSAITRFIHNQANAPLILKPGRPTEAHHRAVEKKLAAAGL